MRETKMFGIFGGERGKVRKLRLHFEDIRQRVLYKMNGFEQYSFATAYVSLFDEVEEHIASQGSAPNHKQLFAADLRLQAETAWRMGRVVISIVNQRRRARMPWLFTQSKSRLRRIRLRKR
jgi:hypothetical protein